MRMKWETKLGIFLVGSSLLIYLLKTVLMGRVPDTYAFILNALGFLPINVLLVTLILSKLLNVRAQEAKMEKLNMVIGTFFSEMGTDLLAELASHDDGVAAKQALLKIDAGWEKEDFKCASRDLGALAFEVNPRHMNLPALREFFLEKRNFLLRLMENPMLYEHEAFTDVLRAIFHLTEELERRKGKESLPESDVNHLKGDFQRVYERLVPTWLHYMDYQRLNYPYLFSLAVRTNPFDREASPVVTA